jgi:membrane associated rhomboid family serine protease
MFLPIKDDAPLRIIRFQTVTLLIIMVNVLVFVATGVLPQPAFMSLLLTDYGVVPVELLHPAMALPVSLSRFPEPATVLTYMFLHLGWLHLIFNMAFLWVFADNVEDAFGHFGFALFYILCGIIGVLVHAMALPHSPIPVVGASGAVSGVLGAYILLFPKARLWVIFYLPIPFRIPAVVVLGIWFALQVLNIFAPGPDSQAVAWWVHIGGFLAGLLLTVLLRARLFLRT